LVSWSPTQRVYDPEGTPSQAHVKGELKSDKKEILYKASKIKRADILAQDANSKLIKKSILKSIIIVSFILILELVVYFAWSRFK
jgi:hypothetical protein